MTDKQRALLRRAVEDGGEVVLMNRSDTMVSKSLAAEGLGTHSLCFEINDAGRRQVEADVVGGAR